MKKALLIFGLLIFLSISLVFAKEITKCEDSDDGINYDMSAYITVYYDDGTVETFRDTCHTGNPVAYYCGETGDGKPHYWSSTNEEITCTPSEPTNKPDLVVTEVLFIPDNPKENELIKIRAFVENHGEGIANKLTIGFDYIPAVSLDFIRRIGGELVTESILVGDSIGYETEIKYNKAGYYNVTFSIEDEYELNPSDNVLTKQIFINCAAGCFNKGICIPYGNRIEGMYCSSTGELALQKEGEVSCENNYECESNLCTDNECVSLGLWRRFLNWLKRLFS